MLRRLRQMDETIMPEGEDVKADHREGFGVCCF